MTRRLHYPARCALVAALTLAVPSLPVAQEYFFIPSSGATPAPVVAACPTFAPRIVMTGVTDREFNEEKEILEANAMRPVSISAARDPETGVPLFDIIAVEDESVEPPDWGMVAGLNRLSVNSTLTMLQVRPMSIDAYLSESGERLYAISWVKDGTNAEFSVGVTLDQLREDNEEHTSMGLRPVWIDGFHNGQNTRYSAIWLGDGVQREMDLSPLESGDANTAWEDRTDQGQRMLRLTQFEVNDGDTTATRRMSVWQTDSMGCAGSPWAAFPADDDTTFRTTLIAQNVRTTEHVVEDGEIEVDLDDLPGLILVSGSDQLGGKSLHRIAPLGTLGDGTIAILALNRPAPVFSVADEHYPTFDPEEDPPDEFDEAIEGNNIRLRRWNVGGGVSNDDVDNHNDCVSNALLYGCSGQTMVMTKFHNRIALQWDAAEEVWREIKRGGLLPDRYQPVSTDAHYSGNDRRTSTTWVGQQERFLRRQFMAPENTTEEPSPNFRSMLTDLDEAILLHMRARRIPHGTFSIAVDGRVVDARSYSAVPENFLDDTEFGPDTPFHIASISKPVTALAIMRLVDAGALDLDMPITDIPGVNDLIGTDWADIDMTQVTTRILLYHLGGWDRGRDGEISLSRDFDICAADGEALPVTMERMLAFGRTEPVAWAPGEKHTYTNFGYTLLGRVIEAVSGQSYADFVQTLVFPPDVASGFVMAPSVAPWNTEEPIEVIEGYDVRSSQSLSVWGPLTNTSHALRESCNPDHADRLPRPQAHYNTGLTDSHGGWIADAASTARLFSRMQGMMSADAYASMANYPTGRELRIVQESTLPTTIDHTYQLVQASHPLGSAGVDLSAEPAGNRIFIGLGLNTFGTINIDLAATASVSLPVTATYSGAFNAFLDLELDDDGTQGLTQSGEISFSRPDSWRPQALFGETQPRFWVALQFGDIPTTSTSPVINQIQAGSPVSRSLAFVATASAWTLDVTDFVAPVGSFEIVGQQSQASAVVTSFTNAAGASTLSLSDKSDGSFIPGEVLGVVGPNDPAFAQIALVGEERERPVTVDLEHGGSLPGVDTHATRRSDGISWALFFAQGASTTPFYIARGGNLLEQNIDDIIDGVPLIDWPSWNIAPPE